MLNNQDFAQKRSLSLGGSDIGAILGLSKFRSAVDVWLEKTGKSYSTKNSLPLRFGSFAESFVAKEYELATGHQTIEHPQTITHPEYSYCTGHIDRLVQTNPDTPVVEKGIICTPRLLECKTSGAFQTHEWGTVGSDEVPMSYLVQCQWYLMLTGCQIADLAVLMGNHDFRIYAIAHDPELSKVLLQKAIFFWEEYVQKDIPPPTASEIDLKKVFPRSTSLTQKEMSNEIYDALQELKNTQQLIDEHESHVSEIKQKIMAYMQDTESLTYQGKTLVTWKTAKPGSRLNNQQLSKDYPDIYQQYTVPTEASRRFLVKE